MSSRKAIAKAYVALMDKHSSAELSAGLAQYLAESKQKVDVDLLVRDISAELLASKQSVTGSLRLARKPAEKTVSDIEAAVAKALDAKTVALDVAVEPSLIGGFIVDTAAGSYDASTVRMLDDLEVA